MRAATASAREPRGERTLMGIGPEFIRREFVSGEAAGTLDGVPQERMDRTPSSPIVVEPQAVSPARTVRVPLPTPARTMQVSLEPVASASREQTLPPGRPSPRLDSFISSRFFQEGEQQEAKNWEDSPLVNEPFPDEEPPKFSSFDRVPRHHAPMIVTTFLLGIALVIGVAFEGGRSGAARALLATSAGSRAAEVWHRARTGLGSGLALRLTPESTAASARAIAAPAAPGQMAVAAPVVAMAPAVATPAAAPEAKAAPLPVERRREPDASARRSVEARRPTLASKPDVAHVVAAPAMVERQVSPRASAAESAAPAPRTEPAPEGEGRAEAPRRGLVWSPSQERLVPAQALTAELPAASATPSSKDDSAPQKPATTGDTDVLPLDDQSHTTY